MKYAGGAIIGVRNNNYVLEDYNNNNSYILTDLSLLIIVSKSTGGLPRVKLEFC